VAITAAGPAAIRSAEHVESIAAVLAKPIQLDELSAVINLQLGRTYHTPPAPEA
jgi:hypothetical protein